MKRFSGLRRKGLRFGQTGSAAVEFALVLPIMLGVAYAGIVYAYIYVLQQSINFAAQQGAQAAVSTIPISTGGTPAANAAATTAAKLASAKLAIDNTLSWLPLGQRGRYTIPQSATGCNAPNGTFAVQVNFNTNGLFAALNLPLLGSFPAMPQSLLACAVAFGS